MRTNERSNEEKRYWSCCTDSESILDVVRMLLIIGAVILAAAMIYMLTTGVTSTYLTSFLIGFGAVVLIVLAVCGLVYLTRNHFPIPYTMTEDCIKYGEGKSERFVYFSDVFTAEEAPGKIRLRTRFFKHVIYIPESEYDEIRDIILARIEEKGKFH